MRSRGDRACSRRRRPCSSRSTSRSKAIRPGPSPAGAGPRPVVPRAGGRPSLHRHRDHPAAGHAAAASSVTISTPGRRRLPARPRPRSDPRFPTASLRHLRVGHAYAEPSPWPHPRDHEVLDNSHDHRGVPPLGEVTGHTASPRRTGVPAQTRREPSSPRRRSITWSTNTPEMHNVDQFLGSTGVLTRSTASRRRLAASRQRCRDVRKMSRPSALNTAQIRSGAVAGQSSTDGKFRTLRDHSG